jgi:hypothetical protein
MGVLAIDHVPKPPRLAVRGGCWFENLPLRIHLGVELLAAVPGGALGGSVVEPLAAPYGHTAPR